MSQKKFKEALALLERLIKEYPDNIGLKLIRCDVLLRAGQFAEALDSLNRLAAQPVRLDADAQAIMAGLRDRAAHGQAAARRSAGLGPPLIATPPAAAQALAAGDSKNAGAPSRQHPVDGRRRLAVGLGVAGGVVALAISLCVGLIPRPHEVLRWSE